MNTDMPLKEPHDEPALYGLIRNGDLQATTLYLQEFPHDKCSLPRNSSTGTTALMYSVQCMMRSAIHWQNNQPRPEQQQDTDIETRIVILTRVAQYSSYFDDVDHDGRTALHYAATCCREDNYTAQEYESTITHILAVVSEAVLECLLPEVDHTPQNDCLVARSLWIRDSKLQTALHAAIRIRNYKAATLLFQRMACNPQRSYRDYDIIRKSPIQKHPEHEPLLTYCLEHDVTRKFLKLLLQIYPEAAALEDSQGRLPLVTALEQTLTTRKVYLLLQAFVGALRIPTGDGDLPLHLAALYYHANCGLSHDERLSVLQLLVTSYPIALTVENNHEQWPLHCAMEIGPTSEVNNNMNNSTIDLSFALVKLLSNHTNGGIANNANISNGLNENIGNIGEGTEEVIGNAEIALTAHANTARMNLYSFDSLLELPLDDSIESSTEDTTNFALQSNRRDRTSEARAFSEDLDDALETVSALYHADSYGELPLHLACRRLSTVSVETLQWLLQANPEAIKTTNNYGHLPLHLAAALAPTTTLNDNILNGLKILIQVFPKSLYQADNEGDMPLLCALSNSEVQPELVECFLSYFGHNSFAKNCFTLQLPLHVACQSGVQSICVFDQLIESDPDALFCYDQNGLLPLHIALQQTEARVSTVRKLIHEASKLYVNRFCPPRLTTTTLPCTADGTPALFVACQKACYEKEKDIKSLDVVRFLVEQSPELFRLDVC